MMNALAGQSFVNMADMLQALKEHEVGSAQSPLHIVGAEGITEDITTVDWEGIRIAMGDEGSPYDESFGSIPIGLGESFGSILIGLDLSAETDIGGLHVVITPEPGEPLSAREQAKLDTMEEKSGIVFFGEFKSGEELEWAMAPVTMETDSIAATEDTIATHGTMVTDGSMATGDTVATESTVVAEELCETKF